LLLVYDTGMEIKDLIFYYKCTQFIDLDVDKFTFVFRIYSNPSSENVLFFTMTCRGYFSPKNFLKVYFLPHPKIFPGKLDTLPLQHCIG
jgi:hypothetical protein